MADFKFKIGTPAGQTADRKLYAVYGNADTYENQDWHIMGSRVEDSSAENDHSTETKTDITGVTRGTMKVPTITQSFEPCEIDSNDKYQEKLLNLEVVEQDVAALSNQDLLRVHLYLVDDDGNAFAERYPSSMVEVTGLGGSGGGPLTAPVNVTFGGDRIKGTAKVVDGKVIFTPEDK